jgi:hypothetical protein
VVRIRAQRQVRYTGTAQIHHHLATLGIDQRQQLRAFVPLQWRRA